jgi:hypothetical protein
MEAAAEGTGVDVAWATGENTYALLARTDVAAFQVKLTRGGSSGWAI